MESPAGQSLLSKFGGFDAMKLTYSLLALVA